MLKRHTSFPYELKTKSLKEDKEGVVKEKGAVAGHLEVNMRPRRKMKMWVLVETRGMRVSTTLVQEEVEDMDKVQEEEASVVPISIAMKKVIEPLNSHSDKEGHIGELRIKLGLLMWMRMHSHHIQRMRKEERF